MILLDWIQHKLRLQSQAEINNDYLIAVWNFYQVYSVACCISGIQTSDDEINLKNHFFSRLILSPENVTLYSKLLRFMRKDFYVINLAMEIIQKKQEEGKYFGDNYQFGMIGISTLYD